MGKKRAVVASGNVAGASRSRVDRARVEKSSKRAHVATIKRILPSGYSELLEDLKKRIRRARVKVAIAANRELIELYWGVGHAIVRRQKIEGWGRSIVERLARDIGAAFPGIRGFSPQSIWKMRQFYLAWTAEVKDLSQPVRELDGTNLPQPVRELPWGHNTELLSKLDDPSQRLWYAQQVILHGWSRAVLAHQIDSAAHLRAGKAITNFSTTIPPADSDLVHQLLKDPYNLDFLTLTDDAHERDLQRGLIDHIKRFLLELGTGFAFVGEQFRLEVGGDDFFLDLLFYHLHLRRYIVIDLKVEPFKPEFAGKMNFYLSASDDLLRHADDKPSIGLILCRTRNQLVAEYALRDVTKPMGVATYATKLPEQLRQSLPSPEELATELNRVNRNRAIRKSPKKLSNL